MSSNVTYKYIRQNPDIHTYIKNADAAVKAQGYTEHSFAHVEKVADTVKMILEGFGYDERKVELGMIAAYLHDIGRAEYVAVTDYEAVNAFEYIAKTEGIICAIESAHAVAHLMKIAPTMSKDDIIICCLSGRGDKDVAAIARYRGEDIHE